MKNRILLAVVAQTAFALSFAAWGAEPRFNEVYRVTTHNSYYVDRSLIPDPFAHGTQERLLDQLVFDRARAIELDIHPAGPGEWAVYHTENRADTFCGSLTDCLKQLQQFQYVLPEHEPVVVLLELKAISRENFDADHTPADLDRLIESELGAELYRPRDFLGRCPSGATLRQCAAAEGWPTVREMRGKFVFIVQGTWHTCHLGHGANGWATYATWDHGVADRSAFPIETNGDRFDHEGCDGEFIPEPERTSARQASVFLEVENGKPGQEDVKAFLAAGGIVRAGNSANLAEQQQHIGQGFQMFRTDFPWYQLFAPDWREVLHVFAPAAFAQPKLVEPGVRLLLSTQTAGAPEAFAVRWEEAAAAADWETFPSTTRPSPDARYPNPHQTRGMGCLRAESPEERESVELCRQTVTSTLFRRKPVNEDAAITLVVRQDGRVTLNRVIYTGSHTALTGVGDLLRLKTWPAGGGSCYAVFSSSEMVSARAASWRQLWADCLPLPLLRRGIAASNGDVLFTHTLRNGTPVTGRELELQQLNAYYQMQDLSTP